MSASLVLTLYTSPVMADRSFSLRAIYANRAESVTNGLNFFPSVMWTEGESETARLEKLFMIYWFYLKKIVRGFLTL